MATPLTDRNLTICASCTDCIEGRGCQYIIRNVGFKFSIPRYARHIERLERIKKPKSVKKPENEKYITPEVRIGAKTRRAIALGKIQKPDICQECGKKGEVDTHHPDYQNPDLIEFLCRFCHNKRAERGKHHSKLPEPARQRRLNLLRKKNGEKIKDLFLNFYDHPELSKADLGELVGVTRERTRQLLIQIHGTTKKTNLTQKCKATSLSPYTSEILNQLIYIGHKPKRIKGCYFSLKNNLRIEIRKFTAFKPYVNNKYYDNRYYYYRIHHLFDTKPDFYIGKIENDVYIVPVPNHKPKTMHYFNVKRFPQYKEAWHLLENPK